MKVLYIGHFNEGSTSRMRGEVIREVLCQNSNDFKLANIDIPLNSTNRVFRSLGWRLKIGPMIKRINSYLLNIIGNAWEYDLVWVDKGVFIYPEIIQKLSIASGKVVHFTPDPAFSYHRSELFFNALKYYDVCITTKSFEMDLYRKEGIGKVLFCTQGFQPATHKPYHSFAEKRGIAFIGHYEKNRADILQKCLTQGYDLKLAGIGWEKFAKKNSHRANLCYLGKGIFGVEYAKVISGALVSIGFLSKIIPELHTTRSIEIPACKTALLTERTSETESLYTDEEALFFCNEKELFEKIEFAFTHKEWLEQLTLRGFNKVTSSGLDYRSIVKRQIQNILG